MTNESQKVLNSFTRKLANCRHNVSVKKLIEYFDGGQYGYSVDDGIPTVVTNDYAFADDIANLVTHIRAIFKSPRLFLKKENIIQNVSVATKMDVQSMQDTYRDDKNWKMQEEEPKPEIVHTFTYEDNYAIYENRFICALIDAVYEIVGKKINQLCWQFTTLSNKIKDNRETPFNSVEFLRFSATTEEIPLLASDASPEVNVVGSLIKSKKRLQSLQGRDIYIQCKKAEKFSLKNVRSTNILTFDSDYHFCYNFYLNYLFREPVLATPKQMYLDFVTVNLFRALTLCGYELENPEATVAVSNSISLRYEGVAFANDLFTITVSPTDEGDLMLKVKANPDFNESIFMVRVVDSARVKEQNLFADANDYARELNANRAETVMREFLVSDWMPVKEPNAFYVEPSRADAIKQMQDVVRNCTMLAEGSFYIHSRICPVCGSNLVAPDGNDYYCALCETTYHIFSFGAQMFLWLKQLPDVATGNEPLRRTEKETKPVNFRLRLRVEQPEEPLYENLHDEDILLQEVVEDMADEEETPLDEVIEEQATEATETVEEVKEVEEKTIEEKTEEKETPTAPAIEEAATQSAPTRARMRVRLYRNNAEKSAKPVKDDDAEVDVIS